MSNEIKEYVTEVLESICNEAETPAQETTQNLIYFLLIGDDNQSIKQLKKHISLFLKEGYAYADDYKNGDDIFEYFRNVNEKVAQAGGLKTTATCLFVPVIFQNSVSNEELNAFFLQSKKMMETISHMLTIDWQPIVVLENALAADRQNVKQKNCLDLVRIWVKELRENYCGDSNIYHICVISDNVHHISVDLQMQTIFFTAISISEYTDKLCCSDNKLVHIDNPNKVLMFTAKAFTLAEPKKMNFLTKILLLSKEFLMQKYSPDFEQKFGRKLADNAREFFWKGSFEKLPLGRDNVIETSPILSFTSNASFEQIEQFEKKYYFSNVPIDEEFLREKQVGFQEKFFQWIFSEDGTFSWLKKYFTCNRIEQSRFFDLIPQMKVSQVIEQRKNDNQKILNEKLEKRYRELYENLISRDKGLCFNDFLQIEEIVEHFINDLIITVEQLINELNCEEWNEEASDEAVGQKDAIFKTWNSAIMTKIFSSSNMNEAQIQNELKNMISDSLTYFQDNRDFLGNIMDQLKVSSYDWVGFRNSIYDCFEFLVKMVYVGIGEDNSALNKDQYVFYRNEKYAPLIEKIKEDGKQTGWIEKSIQNEDRIEGVRFSAAYKLESLMGLNGEWGQV